MERKAARRHATRRVLDEATVDALLAKLRSGASAKLTGDDCAALQGIVETWAHLTEVAASPKASITQIRRMLGLARSRREQVPQSSRQHETAPADSEPDPSPPEADDATEASADIPASEQNRKNRNEHGRRRADDFGELAEANHAHSLLKPGDTCPECLRGRVYKYRPNVFTTVSGRSPLVATRHTQERLACNLCKAVFDAPLPTELEDDGIGGRTLYSFSAVAIVAVYRFFGGVPMHRQQQLQKALGVAIPDASIWDMCERLANVLRPVRHYLVEQAANAKLFYGDDTGATILATRAKVKKNRRTGKNTVRTGCHTTCVIAMLADQQPAILFLTGIHHTGEVMDLILADRDAALPPPIFMGDGIESNTVTTSTVYYAGCNAHAVRRFKALAETQPEHTSYVLERYAKIYANEDTCIEAQVSDDERLAYHRMHSRPLLREITEYGEDLFEQRKVEPNSDLGSAFDYVISNERRLSAFARHPGAPLDNNRCERTLRICVRLRETARFFRNPVGAAVADTVLSVGGTAQAVDENLFEYFVAVQRHADDVRQHPSRWVPWAYRQRLRELSGSGPPPSHATGPPPPGPQP